MMSCFLCFPANQAVTAVSAGFHLEFAYCLLYDVGIAIR